MSGYDPLLEDLFAPLGGVTFRRMFGGVGIFKDTLMFALVIDDTVHMKVNDTTKAAYEAEGCAPWVYEGRKGPVTMPYWPAPERLFDEPEEFAEWARTAFGVAVANRAAKTGPRKKAKATGQPKAKTKTAPKRRARPPRK